MRLADFLRAALGSLWQQKARTLLTLTGVIVGTCSLAFSLSLGVGLRSMIDREFQKRGEFWWIRVFTGSRGTAPESDDDLPASVTTIDPLATGERAERLRQSQIETHRRFNPPKTIQFITPAIMEKIRALPDVDDIRTTEQGSGRYTLGDRAGEGLFIAAPLDQFDPPLESLIIHGRLPAAAGECIVSESALYRWGFRADAAIPGLIGQPLDLSIGDAPRQKGFTLASLLGPANPADSVTPSQAAVFDRIVKQLPDKIDTFDLSIAEKAAVRLAINRSPGATPPPPSRSAVGRSTIVGIIRGARLDERPVRLLSDKVAVSNATDVYLRVEDGSALLGQIRSRREQGFTDIKVHCRSGGDLRGTVDALKSLNLEVASAVDWYESSKLEVTLIAAGLNVFSIVALAIAAIGITNTLVTSVLERTREIGIIKALGATDGVVVRLFLIEGAVIGILGGGLGVLLARIIANPADGLVKSLVQKVSRNRILAESVFEFPFWVWGGSLLFAIVVTTLAAWYPARRASRIEPVEALRHE
jgi:putative ABC transport system permease protein